MPPCLPRRPEFGHCGARSSIRRHLWSSLTWTSCSWWCAGGCCPLRLIFLFYFCFIPDIICGPLCKGLPTRGCTSDSPCLSWAVCRPPPTNPSRIRGDTRSRRHISSRSSRGLASTRSAASPSPPVGAEDPNTCRCCAMPAEPGGLDQSPVL